MKKALQYLGVAVLGAVVISWLVLAINYLFTDGRLEIVHMTEYRFETPGIVAGITLLVFVIALLVGVVWSSLVAWRSRRDKM